jgi:hypothetical protein
MVYGNTRKKRYEEGREKQKQESKGDTGKKQALNQATVWSWKQGRNRDRNGGSWRNQTVSRVDGAQSRPPNRQENGRFRTSVAAVSTMEYPTLRSGCQSRARSTLSAAASAYPSINPV